MQVDDDAPVDEIKKAYRSLAKECHPDYLGDRGHDICILLNEVGPAPSSGTRPRAPSTHPSSPLHLGPMVHLSSAYLVQSWAWYTAGRAVLVTVVLL